MEATENLIGTKGAFEIQDRMPFARGRISILYKATDEHGETVCVKLFDEPPVLADDKGKSKSGFWVEIQAQMKLKHPNILPVLDYAEGKQPFIIYPLCRNGTLRDIIDEREFVPLDEALSLLKQVAAAVDFAHSAGIIHGDIKPENILFQDDRSTPLLSDFGMSKHFPHVERIRTIVEEPVAGTSAYLSPEQISESKQSLSSDIYAFGVVSFEVLTGKLPVNIEAPPFKQMQDKVAGKLMEPQDVNPAISDQCSAALKAALAVNRKHRPATAGEFYKQLSGQIPVESRQSLGGWLSSLDTKSTVALISALIAGLVAIVTAAIKIIPDLLK